MYSKKIILRTLIVLISIHFNVFGQTNKKIKKEIISIFNIQDYILEPFQLNEEVKKELPIKISNKNFFKIKNDETVIGYAYTGIALSKDNVFDYLVLFDKHLIISKIKVLAYRENYGGEIASKRWLKQFVGKSTNDKLQYEKDIIAISGATISANSLTNSINKLLNAISMLQQKNIFK